MLGRTYEKIRGLFEKEGGYVSTRMLLDEKVSTIHIKELVESKDIEKVSHGNYWGTFLHIEKPENYKMIEACMTNRKAVICGLSACNYHGLLKSKPKKLYIATRRTDRGAMKLTFPVSRHFFSLESFDEGIVTWDYHDINVKLYDIDRSVVDAIRLAEDKSEKSVREVIKTYKERSDADLEKCIAYADSMRVGRIVRDMLDIK